MPSLIYILMFVWQSWFLSSFLSGFGFCFLPSFIRLMLLCDVHLGFSNAIHSTVCTCNCQFFGRRRARDGELRCCCLFIAKYANRLCCRCFVFFSPSLLRFLWSKMWQKAKYINENRFCVCSAEDAACQDTHFSRFCISFLFCLAVLSSVFRTKDSCRNSLSAYCFSIILWFVCVCALVCANSIALPNAVRNTYERKCTMISGQTRFRC